jgi:murein DD-endopeptidase MepM/ murein hydrolase activator NlpD
MTGDDRRLSFIIVPHGDLQTRTYEISYRRLKALLWTGVVLAVMFVVVVSTWWHVASRAALVPGLRAEVNRLEAEREQVVELARTLSEVESQYERVRQMLGADAGGRDAAALMPPLSTPAGAPREPERQEAGLLDSWPLTTPGFVTQELGAAGRHPGLDIAVPRDSYIRAAGPGVVRESGKDDVYGNFVLIHHGGGLESMYGHASRVFVAVGDSVERNQVIALSGSTGRSTAPHLHFEVRRDGVAVDPLAFVDRP